MDSPSNISALPTCEKPPPPAGWKMEMEFCELLATYTMPEESTAMPSGRAMPLLIVSAMTCVMVLAATLAALIL